MSDNDERDANQLGAGKSAGKRISLWIDFIIGGNFESEDCIGDSSVKWNQTRLAMHPPSTVD